MKIKTIKAKKILNSRNKPTIEITINKKYTAAAPSGASTGGREAVCWPDQGIDYAIDFINKQKELKKFKFETFQDLAQVEQYTPQVQGNPIIALQFAILKAMAEGKVYKFLNPEAYDVPMPLGNVIGGGAHLKGKGSDVQEFLLLPKAKTAKDAVFANNYIHKLVGKELGIKRLTDEGAWAPELDTESILDLLKKVVDKVSDELGFKIGIGMDVAASQFYKDGTYNYTNYSKTNKEKVLTPDQQIAFMKVLMRKYKLTYIEDPLEEEDMEGFGKLTQDAGKTLIVGDDLICTNPGILKKAIGKINSLIIKPNQIGSLIKTKETVDIAHKNGITPVISHRSGETMDNTIADLAVAWNIPIIKTGIYGKERTAKLKRVMEIEKEVSYD